MNKIRNSKEEFSQQKKLKVYEKPKLTEYGDMEKLTKSGYGTTSDGELGRKKLTP